MIDKVQQYCKRYETDPEGTIEEMSGFLKGWLVNHIAGTDQKYSDHLLARGVR
jgi:hemerythrin